MSEKIKRGDSVAVYWPNDPDMGISDIFKATRVARDVVFVTHGAGLSRITTRYKWDGPVCRRVDNPGLAIRLATDADREAVALCNEHRELLGRLRRIANDGEIPIDRLRAAVAALEGDR